MLTSIQCTRPFVAPRRARCALRSPKRLVLNQYVRLLLGSRLASRMHYLEYGQEMARSIFSRHVTDSAPRCRTDRDRGVFNHVDRSTRITTALYVCGHVHAIVIMGGLAIFRTPTDIFPNINIPVVSIIWNYNGLVPEDMSDRIVSVTERALTTTVDNIEHIESQSLYGVAVVKVFLQPNANVATGHCADYGDFSDPAPAVARGNDAAVDSSYSASSVPVLQLALSGQGLSEQQLNDYGLNFIRTQLITVPGASVPYPYGGNNAR